ncbi:MAG: hypothetical protein A2504_10560 [Bdellovibrionales bacterium RIFOXYD12_FULL_39_22]|nr:MAG: hypothetical protein A2385_14195 [Bdellovibrionales bacterium RIFOXYB1_FULL_39_21]OFZ40386.1 MAG: hypothetical protein A2485_02885 [Bdellovibrionales bacterium RIFOXYC12_FULL_39_17]OFZ49635.1 MAG: hypothetical protein A2404_09345 [Bdellovibrionales bacterium RIFOXYC1_FULL_39_130]OFZ77305.1 MAG: hypothetical protein A2560_06010 [Bdellovibrionales bacterium RIFOXYD1_FULL_39_84]OFZ95960.1 MAG: hypothetical protein A2504_10560 [Bdellovibrionales bacterium RIFOXYD12_FULL_39_22]HLE11221.1 hy
MKIFFLLCIFVWPALIPWGAQAQDERLFKKIISGDFTKIVGNTRSENYLETFISKFYAIDLNSDGFDESVAYEKSDGQDWIRLHDAFKRPIIRFKLDTVGKDSYIYKIGFRKLGPQIKVLLIYFYEGQRDYLQFVGSSRLYLIAVENNDLTKLEIAKGPIVFEEMRQSFGHYHKRYYEVSLYDYNGDGIKEVAAKYNTISHVMSYRGSGQWSKF